MKESSVPKTIRSKPETNDSIAVAFAMIYFSRFLPKKRMSSPKAI
jgi:hypothetical protein